MKNYLLIVPVFLLLFSCRNTNQENVTDTKERETPNLSVDEKAFLNNLVSLCGKSFAGKETYSKDGRDSWVNRSMVIHFTVCETDLVKIPFHIDDDQSRTWVFMNENGKLRFQHDHRHKDGSPEDLTLYGGYADGKGNAFRQSFPADDYTNRLINDNLDRVWNIILSEDFSFLKYELGYDGEIVFRAEFDLTTAL
ncbi:MAG: hypothetical protein ACOCW7_02880 [Bacteroidota bacterium]